MYVTERCRRCRHHGYVCFGDLCCDYMYRTGKPRGCPAGDDCDKFEEMKESEMELAQKRIKEKYWGKVQ